MYVLKRVIVFKIFKRVANSFNLGFQIALSFKYLEVDSTR